VLLFRAPAVEEPVGDIVCVSVTSVTRTLPFAAVDDDIAVTVLSTGGIKLEVDADVVDVTTPPGHEVPKSVFTTVAVTGKTVV